MKNVKEKQFNKPMWKCMNQNQNPNMKYVKDKRCNKGETLLLYKYLLPIERGIQTKYIKIGTKVPKLADQKKRTKLI